MSSKPKSNPLNGVHTAGIFSDLSVDGPVIGTLVLVVDRAKNLPNRKTIGKQDPYCAARLGKEAKKTKTDIRGGQTPRWDQELRFTVHDSPDYFQLKVSVFSDDKKTELIGENWIDLRDIIVAGGGQSDQWQTLNFRGKYAGEVRMEITYYDSRPKPEKAPAPAAVSATTSASAAAMAGSMRGRSGGDAGGSGTGTMGPRAPNAPKRRPLPSDPVTGQPAAQPQPPPTPQAVPVAAQPAGISPGLPQHQQVPEHTQTPPRAQPNPPSTYTPNHSPLPPVTYNNTPPQPAPYQQQSPASPAPPVRYQNYQDPDPYMAGPDGGYESTPPVSHPQHHHHQSRHSHHSHHSHSHDRSQYAGRDVTPDFHEHQQQPYDQQQDARDYHFDGAPAHAHAPAPVMAPSFEDADFAQPVDDRPPPPPVHRSRNNSSGAVATDAMFRSSFDASAQKGTPPPLPTMRRDVLRSEAHRHSISSAYPGRPTYRPLDAVAAPSAPTSGPAYGAPAPDASYQPSPPHHPSYDSAYDGQYSGEFDNTNDGTGALVPASFRKSVSQPPPPPPQQYQQQQQQQQYQEPYQEQYQEQPNYEYSSPGFEKVPSPAPLNVVAHRSSFSASPAPMYTAATTTPHRQSVSSGYVQRSPSPMVSHDYSRTSPSPQPGPPGASSYNTYDPRDDPYQTNHGEPDNTRYREPSEAYMLPPVPASLVPGVDPSLALELRSRIHQDERRSEQQQQQQPQPEQRYTLPSQSTFETPPKATPPRSRQTIEGASRSSLDYDNVSQTYTPQRSQLPQAYNTPPQPASQPSQPRYDRSPGPYSSGAPSPAVVVRPRGASPNPHHTIKRKSVSPAPATAPSEGARRLSGIPFGPDSYDELNPALAASKNQVRPDYNEASGKIIAHDGREIDPSDHLPVESWAPEPEPKPSKPESATASPRDYSTPTSGRKQLRIAGRPQSSMGSSGVTFSSADDPGTTYTPTARNRLQKKANRQSTAAIPVSSGALSSGSPQGSTPLAPLTHPRQQQDNFTPPRALGRASTFDFPNENHAPTLYGSSPGRTSFGSSAPPIPAKVPAGAGGGVGSGSGGSPYGGASHTGSYRGSRSYGGGGAGGFVSDGDRSPVMSGALTQPSGPAMRALPWNDGPGAGAGASGGSGEMALMEEMSRIDIGTGRARRHQGRY